MICDCRQAWRGWRRRPVVPVCIVVVLTLGITVNASVFAAIEGFLVSPLAVEYPDRLVSLGDMSYPVYQAAVEELDGVTGVAGFFNRTLTLTEGVGAEPLRGTLATTNYFSVLGVAPQLGRTFVSTDTQVAVISEGYWQAALGGRPDAIGQNLLVHDVALEIIGVVPGSFEGTVLGDAPDVWTPLPLWRSFRPGGSDVLEHRVNRLVSAFARLADDTTAAEVAVAIERLESAVVATYPELGGWFSIEEVPLAYAVLPPGRRQILVQVLGLLQAAAVAVFLMAIANLVTLIMASIATRRSEFAIRAAYGARWWQVARPVTVEYLLLGASGGVFGSILAYWVLAILARLNLLAPVDAGLYTLGVVGILTVIAPVTAGGMVALYALRGAWAGGWQPVAAGTTRSFAGRAAFMRAPLAVQVALSLGLMCVALWSVERVQSKLAIAPGFRSEDLVRMNLDLAQAGYTNLTVRPFRELLLREVAALPGIHSVGWGTSIPFDGITFGTDASRGDGNWSEVLFNPVEPQFLSVLGVPVLHGRDLVADDRGRAVAVINQQLARRLWPGENPVGRRLDLRGMTSAEIVGVAGDTRYRNLGGPGELFVYLPPDNSLVNGHLVVRTNGAVEPVVSALRARIRALDPQLVTHDLRSMDDILEDLVRFDRLIATTAGTFGMVSLVLVSLGLSGAMARMVEARRREIGTRLALGAQTGSVLLLLLGEGGLVLIGGVTGGVGVAAACWHLARSHLAGLEAPSDMVATIGGASVVLGVVGMLALLASALGVRRINPAVTLQAE